MSYIVTAEEKGIPIGNLLSQLYALIYLNSLDHYVKRELRCKLYCRYVDDFILFDLDRDEAIEAQRKIELFVASTLGLSLSKWQIRSTQSGSNFVGYRTWRSKRFIRKHSMYKFRRAARKCNLATVVSILGHAQKTSSLSHLLNYLRVNHYELHSQLPKIYQLNNNKKPSDTRGVNRAVHN